MERVQRVARKATHDDGQSKGKNNNQEHRSFQFTFTKCWAPPTEKNPVTQQGIFEEVGAPIVRSLTQGYNAALLAYGQTGSGKTHTMMGHFGDVGMVVPNDSEEMHEGAGLTPRICSLLFRKLEEEREASSRQKKPEVDGEGKENQTENQVDEEGAQADVVEGRPDAERNVGEGGDVLDAESQVTVQSTVEVSFMEVYNEQCHDLLDPNQNRKSSLRVNGGGQVEGLSQVVVESYPELEGLLCFGQQWRTVGATKMNAASSRSHAVFVLVLTRRRKRQKIRTEVVSKLFLVDLAGSERVKRSGAINHGNQFNEACKINQSLLTLGIVIDKLAKQATAKAESKLLAPSASAPGEVAAGGNDRITSTLREHIPFRDSVLTTILQDALGGNSKTSIIATVSTAGSSVEETLSTLRYASIASTIVTTAAVSETPWVKKMRALQQQVTELQEKLKARRIAAEVEFDKSIELGKKEAREEGRRRSRKWEKEEGEQARKLALVAREVEARATVLQLEQEQARKEHAERMLALEAQRESEQKELLTTIEDLRRRLDGRTTQLQVAGEELDTMKTQLHSARALVVQHYAVSAAKVAAYVALEVAAGAMVAEQERLEEQRRRAEGGGGGRGGGVLQRARQQRLEKEVEKEAEERASQSAKRAAELEANRGAVGEEALGVLSSQSQPEIDIEIGMVGTDPALGPNSQEQLKVDGKGPNPSLVVGKPAMLDLVLDCRRDGDGVGDGGTDDADELEALAAEIAPLTPNISNGRGYSGEERAALDAIAPPSPVALRPLDGGDEGEGECEGEGEGEEHMSMARVDAVAPLAVALVRLDARVDAADDSFAVLEHKAAALRNHRLEERIQEVMRQNEELHTKLLLIAGGEGKAAGDGDGDEAAGAADGGGRKKPRNNKKGEKSSVCAIS
jgi:hypothetical protein